MYFSSHIALRHRSSPDESQQVNTSSECQQNDSDNFSNRSEEKKKKLHPLVNV